ncbi:MAG: hypothetical protein JWP24_418 [Marmoricola sp.]|nr:hypothetical protein [Marmoricola sp.]
MAVAVHILNTSRGDVRQAYERAWRLMDERGMPRHPEGQQMHAAWLVGDVLHVLNVWESQQNSDTFMKTLAPILEEAGLELHGTPEAGEFLQVVQPHE